MHHRITLGFAVFVLSMSSCGAFAADEDPASIVESLFGDRLRAVASTKEHADDILLAKQMLDAESSLRASKGVAPLLCERAYDLTVGSPEGVDTMIASMMRLAEVDPTRKIESHDHIVRGLTAVHGRVRGEQREALGARLVAALETAGDLHTEADDYAEALRQYTRARSFARGNAGVSADHIDGKIERSRLRVLATNRIKQYTQRIKQNPKDEKAGHELVMTYITELDQPEAASKYTFLVDEELASKVQLAVKAPEAIEVAEALELAEWYEQLAASGPNPTRAAMLVRAIGYYGAYVESDAADAGRRAIVRVKLDQLAEQLAKLGPTGGATEQGGGWRVIMPPAGKLIGWSIEGDASDIDYNGGVLTIRGDAHAVYPIKATNVLIHGRVKMDARRTVNLAVAQREGQYFGLIYKTGRIRIVYADGAEAKRDSAAVPGEPGDTLDIEVAIAGQRLTVRVNNSEVLRIELSQPPKPGALRLGSGKPHGSVEFSGFKYRTLSPADVKKRLAE